MPFGWKKKYKKEKNNIVRILKVFLEFEKIYGVLNNTDINDQPIPFRILIYIFSKCLNVNKVE